MKRPPLPIAIVALCVIACGSKTLSPAASRIREGNEADLSDCTFLQKVEGTANDGDRDAETHAKNNAREQAAAIGATHIRWIIPCCTSVEGEAYRCDAPD